MKEENGKRERQEGLELRDPCGHARAAGPVSMPSSSGKTRSVNTSRNHAS